MSPLRRLLTLRHLVVAATLLLPVAVFFAPTLAAGNVPGGVDLRFRSSPWREEPNRPLAVQSPVQVDQAEQLPWVDATWQSLRDGEFPWWSAQVGGGTPLGTTPVFATFSVFTVVGQILTPLTGAPIGLAIRTVLAVLAGELAALAFLRRLRLGMGASVFGAVAYVFSGAVVAFELRNAIPLLLPAVLWAVDRLVERTTPGRILTVAAAVVALWLEGFPAMMVHVVTVAALWWLVRTGGRLGWRLGRREVLGHWMRAGAAFAGALALGALLSAWSMVPFAHQVVDSNVLAARADTTEALGHASIWWLLDEQALGAPDLGPWYTNLNPIEGLAAVGTLVMALAVVGVVGGAWRPRSGGAGDDDLERLDRPVRLLWMAVTLVVVVAVYLGGPLLRLIAAVPGFSNNPFSRSRFVAVFGLVVLAAFGVQWIEDRWRHRLHDPAGVGWRHLVRARRWPLASAAVFVVVLASPFVVSFRELVDVTRTATGPAVGSWRGEIVALAAAAGGLALGALAVRGGRARVTGDRAMVIGVGCALIAFLQVGLQLTRLTPQVDRAFYDPPTVGADALRRAVGRDERFIGSGMGTFTPNWAMTSGLVDARSHSFRDPEWSTMVTAVFPDALALDPLKINVHPGGPVNWTAPAFDDMAIGVVAMSSDEVPLGVRGTIGTASTWTRIDRSRQVSGAGPSGPYVGVDLRMRSNERCQVGDVVVTASRPGQPDVEARRPASDVGLEGQEVIAVALPMADAGPDEPSTLRVRLVGADGRCRIDVAMAPSVLPPVAAVGTAEPGGPPLLSAPILRPPDATWQLVSAVGGWLYQRPSAHPLVRLVDDWSPAASPAAALAAAVAPSRTSSDPMPVAGAAAPTSATTGGTVTSWSTDGGGISATTRSAGPSLLVAAFNSAPGWSVTVDGQAARLVRPDGALLGVAVPAGRHRIRFTYRPPGVRLGLWLTALGVVLSTAVAVVPTLVRRRRDAARPTGE